MTPVTGERRDGTSETLIYPPLSSERAVKQGDGLSSVYMLPGRRFSVIGLDVFS